MVQIATQLIEELKTQKVNGARKLVDQTRMIRKKITVASGKWDAVEVLRHLRHAQK